MVRLRDESRMLPLSVLATAVFALPCTAQGVGFPQLDGWTVASEVRTYDADNLWEYIDGAAELFVAYDMETCHTGDLSSGDLIVTVDYYDMRTPLDAFGVYVQERPDPGVHVEGATEGLVSPPYQALLLKGSTYVKVNVFEGELTEANGRALLEAIAQALPGSEEYPAELDQLPQNGRIDGTAGFQRDGFLGLTELTDCLYAEYTTDGVEKWQGFAMLSFPPESFESIWQRLAGDWQVVDHAGRSVLYREIPYRGLVGVERTPHGIIGVAGATDQVQLVARLESLTRR